MSRLPGPLDPSDFIPGEVSPPGSRQGHLNPGDAYQVQTLLRSGVLEAPRDSVRNEALLR